MKYYLVGIKGTGMSSLAKMLQGEAHQVVGSDTEEYYFTEDSLREKQIPIFAFDQANIQGDAFYIIGNAFHQDNNEEVKAIISRQYPYAYYHDFIGQHLHKKIIAVAGTHGKTTTSYFLAQMLDQKCNFIIGDGEGDSYPSDYLILEACEYQSHFLSYHPEWLIINNIELDHTDYYKSKKQLFHTFQQFASQAKTVLINGDDALASKIKHPHKLTFGFGKKNDIQIKILSTTAQCYYIQINYCGHLYLKVPYLGRHMIYNYVASYMTLYLNGFTPKILTKDQLPHRRLTTYVYRNSILIDDYAHHPTEIKALYETLQLQYPHCKIKAIFQPHTYERTFHFKKEFIQALKLYDCVYLLDVFSSKRETNNPKLQAKVDKIFASFPTIQELNTEQIGKKDEVWVFLGAGKANHILKALLENQSVG